nr:hypothetical protein [Tanacetum cinerariifolium]
NDGGDVGGSDKTKLPKKIQLNMVICMVYETAEAVKNEAYAKSNSDKNAMKKGSQAYRINEKRASLLEAEQKKYVRYGGLRTEDSGLRTQI